MCVDCRTLGVACYNGTIPVLAKPLNECFEILKLSLFSVLILNVHPDKKLNISDPAPPYR